MKICNDDIIYCIDCKYWMSVPTKIKKGECRKNTPLMSPTGDGAWPITRPLDFCHSGKNNLNNIDEFDDDLKNDER